MLRVFPLIVIALFNAFLVAQNSDGIDFFHYWAVPRIVASDSESIYDRESQPGQFERLKQKHLDSSEGTKLSVWFARNEELYHTGLHPTGSPFFYCCNAFFQCGDAGIDYWIFQWGSSLLILFGLTFLGIHFGSDFWKSLLISGLILWFHRAVLSDIGVANVNRVLTGSFAIATCMAMRHRKWESPRLTLSCCFTAGTFLGLLVAYKASVLLGVLLFLGCLFIDKDFRRLIWICAGSLMGLAIAEMAGAVYFGGHACWLQWLAYTRSMIAAPFTLEAGNYSIVTNLVPQAMVSIAVTLCGVAAVLLTLVCFYQTSYRQVCNSFHRPILAGAIGLAIPLLTGPLAWGHYFALTTALVMMICCSKRRQSAAWRLGITGVALSSSPVIWVSWMSPAGLLLSMQLGVLFMIVAAFRLWAESQSHPLSPARTWFGLMPASFG